MPVLGSGSYPTATALDADDILVGLVDGQLEEVPASVARTFVLPSGLVDADDYTAASESVINTADATTGWTATSLHSGSVAVDTAIKTTGTGSVSATLAMDIGIESSLYYTPPGTQSISGRTLVAFDVRINEDGPGMGDRNLVWAKVADGAALTAGNVNSVNLGSVADSTWTTVVLPLVGLSNITSIGVRREDDTAFVSSTMRAIINIDNVRFVDETKLDVAIGSSSTAVAWVPPDYTPDANQRPLTRAGAVDAAKGVWPKHNNVVYLHDYLAHAVGAETGDIDVGFALGTIINSAQPGQTVRATPGAIYKCSQDLEFSGLDGVTIDFTGATIFLTHQTNTPFVTITDCRDALYLPGTLVGYGPTTHLGSNMENVAGTPTDNGTAVELNAQDEEVQLQDNSGWGLPFHYARCLPQQVGEADDGLGLRNYFSVTLSDSAQVTDDCIVTIYDGDTATVLAQETLTLTGTPTAYPIEYFPADLGKRLRLTVKKSTATANTITVTQTVSQGRVSYSSSFDVASAILIASSERITIVRPWIENFGGDAIQISDQSVRDILVIDPVSRGMRRQGFSFNRGHDITVVRPVARECGRSGIDIEPFASTWSAERVNIYDAKFYNITNYAYAMGNWARNIDCVIDGADVYEVRLGVMGGGMRGGVMRNLRNWSVVAVPGDADFSITCQNVAISGLVSQERIVCGTSTNTYNDGSGDVVYTPEGNTLSDIYLKNNLGGVKLKLATGYDIIGPVHVESLARSDFTATTNAFGPIDTAGRAFANTFFGEYYRQFPDTFKAPVASSHLWVPGGYDDFLEPRIRVGALSGTSTRGNNLRGVGASVTEGQTTKAIAFATKAVGTLSQAVLTSGAASSGTLSTATAYYYRLAPRNRYGGPGTYLSQVTRTTGASETAIQLEVEGWMNADLIVEGFTLLRGTTNGGPYTTRYDFVPNEALHGPAPNGLSFYDQGANLVMRDFSDTDAHYGYPQTTAATTGSWDASVNETGYEPDATYGVIVTPNWLTTVQVTAKATSGFTINFGTAAPAGATVDWFLVR